jgi:hypothetical protein
VSSPCGTANKYKRGCRCTDCRAAQMRHMKMWKMGQTGRLIDPTGTHRRIRALNWLGWTWQEIAAACGKSSKEWVGELLKSQRVHSDTAATVERAYAAMSMTAPEGPQRARVRRAAEKRGCVPPMGWLDLDDPDEQPDTGWRPVRNRPAAELLAEWAHLRGLGVSAHHAARQLGVTVEAVEKAIERMKESAA